MKVEKGNLVADIHNIVARWMKYFSQLFNVHGVKDVGRAEVHTAELLVPEPSGAEVELAIYKLKSHKSPGIDQIPAELIKSGGRKICLEIHKLITSNWKKEKLPKGWKESIVVPIHKKRIKVVAIIIESYHFANHLQNFIQHLADKVNSICEGNCRGSSMWLSTQKVDS